MLQAVGRGGTKRFVLLLVATIVESLFVNVVPTDVHEVSAASAWYHGWADSLWLGSDSPYLDVSRSSGLLSGLSLSAYALITAGMWVNSSALTNFRRAEHHGRIHLRRTDLFQLDANYFPYR
jgi:hypothetical protein